MNRKIGVSACIFIVLVVSIVTNMVSAGVGLKWDREAKIVSENERTCFSYAVYNPWPKDSYAKIDVSEELQKILQFQESEEKLIPADTSSDEAIPVEFCFEVPRVYKEGRDCWIGDKFLCAQECGAEQKMFSGEVLVTETGGPATGGGSGGSTTAVSVSAPLKIRVKCNAHSREFTIVYATLAIIFALIIIRVLVKKYRKPKIERDKDRLKRLQEEIRKESNKK